MENELRLAGLDAARDPNFIAQVKTALHLPAEVQLELQNVSGDPQGERAVEYAATQTVHLNGAEFGAADGVAVDERGTVSLRFDGRGRLVASQVSPIDRRHLELVQDQIRKLAAADQIDPAPPGDVPVNRRRPWYVESDDHGRKRLKRAFMT